MSQRWALLKSRRAKKINFRLLDADEAARMIAENVGVPSDVAANALLALDTYNNSGFYRSDELAEWLEKNGNRLSRNSPDRERV
jgi:hypothetical protein